MKKTYIAPVLNVEHVAHRSDILITVSNPEVTIDNGSGKTIYTNEIETKDAGDWDIWSTVEEDY